MGIVKLGDGREVTPDLHAFTLREYRDWLSPAQSEDDGDALIGRTYGLELPEVQSLTMRDYKALVQGIVRAVRDPLEPGM